LIKNNNNTSFKWLKTSIINSGPGKNISYVSFVNQEFIIRARENTKLLGLFLVTGTSKGEIIFYKSGNLSEIGNLKEVTDEGGHISIEDIYKQMERLDLTNGGESNKENSQILLSSVTSIDFSKSWNRNSKQLLAVGLDNDYQASNFNNLQIFYLPKNQYPGTWKSLNLSEYSILITSPIIELTFAKTCGRSFHLLAIASDQGLKILKICAEKLTIETMDICYHLSEDKFNSSNRLARSVKFNSNGQIVVSS